jgi:hypothetical protein
VGASKPEPHPEALVRTYIHAHTQSPWRAEALEALDVLVGRLEQKDEALRFYADENNYDFDGPDHDSAVQADTGERAREALGTEENA